MICWQQEEIPTMSQLIFWNKDTKKNHTLSELQRQILWGKGASPQTWMMLSGDLIISQKIRVLQTVVITCGSQWYDTKQLVHNTLVFFAVWCFTLPISVLFFLKESCSRGVAVRNVAAWKMHDFFRLLATLSFLDKNWIPPPGDMQLQV